MAPDEIGAIGRRAHAAWLLIGGLLTGALLATGSVGSWVILTGTTPQVAKTQRDEYEQRTTRIEIDIEDGDVRVVGGADHVSVERRLEYGEREPTITESWRGDTLVIGAKCDLSRLESLKGRRCTVGYTLRVPGTVDLVANVNVGAIRVDDLDGELRLSTSQGDVEVRNTRGRVRIRSGFGTITATGLRGVEADVKANAGDVSLDFAVPPGLAKGMTGSGSVEVALPRGDTGAAAYHVRADAAYGQSYVDVSSDPTSQHEVFATTGWGDVYVRYSNG